MPYAEVIGDPIAQSKSPLIHAHWLAKLGIDGEFRAVRVTADELPSYIAGRRADPEWRGCNVTIPHKQAVMSLLDELTPEAGAVGAVNCVVARDGRLVGFNTDVDGISAALGGNFVEGGAATVIGAGGGARAMLAFLAGSSAKSVTLLARSVEKAERMVSDFGGRITVEHLDEASNALVGSTLIANASPLGMRGSAPMPEDLLAAVEANAKDATLFDMVYDPLTTEFLRRGASAGGRPIDGLTMLIGQARRAFTLFFGAEAPEGDAELRQILEAKSK